MTADVLTSHDTVFDKDDFSTIKTRLTNLLKEYRPGEVTKLPPEQIESRGFLGSVALFLSEGLSQQAMQNAQARAAEKVKKDGQEWVSNPDQLEPGPLQGFVGSVALLASGVPFFGDKLAGRIENWQKVRAEKREAALDLAYAAFGAEAPPVDPNTTAPNGYVSRHRADARYIGKRRRPAFMQAADRKVEPMPRSHRRPLFAQPRPAASPEAPDPSRTTAPAELPTVEFAQQSLHQPDVVTSQHVLEVKPETAPYTARHADVESDHYPGFIDETLNKEDGAEEHIGRHRTDNTKTTAIPKISDDTIQFPRPRDGNHDTDIGSITPVR